MTVNFSAAQIAERCTVTLTVYGTASLPSAIIVVDGKAYTGIWTPATAYIFTYSLPLERGSHIIYAQVTDSAGTVTTNPIAYVMAYELTEYGIDVYSGDAKLDALDVVLHDELLPALPTLTFSCATLLSGTIEAVIRERGLRKYQFTIDTVGKSGAFYQCTCLAAESYALTTAIMALQTAYGSTADAIRLLVPSLNIIDTSTWVVSTANLIANGEFESNIEGWTGEAGATISRETGAPLVGTGSLKILNTSGQGDAYCFVGTTIGHIYGAVCRAKSTAAAGRLTRFGNTLGPSTDCSTETSLTFIFTASASLTTIGAVLVGGIKDEYLIIDSVACYDITSGNTVNLSEHTTYPQLFANITSVDVIAQLMIQALAQASVRNGNLYVFPLDVSWETPDYHMQRLDPLTGWQKDADIYDAVVAHYVVKQFPTPATNLTLNDKVNWKDANGANVLVYDVTQVSATLLPVPSGATGMLKSFGNCSRAVSTLFKYFDRIRLNWLPVTATSLTVSLQQDAENKLELTHAFAGQIGAGFVLNTGVAPTETLTKDIVLDPVQYVTRVEGLMTARCSYRVTLLWDDGTVMWQDEWRNTISNTFEADVPTSVSQTYRATMVRIEFTDLYLIGVDYGVQCIRCYITKQTWTLVGTHQQVVSTVRYYQSTIVSAHAYNNYLLPVIICPVPTLTGNQTYTVAQNPHGIYYVISGGPTLSIDLIGDVTVSGGNLIWYAAFGPSSNMAINGNTLAFYVSVTDNGEDWSWVSSMFVWSDAFNLFESLDLAFVDFVRTGNPVNLQTIALTFTGDNYLDTLVLVTDNPLPVTVRAGTGQRAFTVTDDFGSEAGAQAYANGLLLIVSVDREQYTLDVPLSTDLGVGDTIDGDGKNYTVRTVDYRQDGKTLAAGRSMDILKTQLREQSRRLDALERKV